MKPSWTPETPFLSQSVFESQPSGGAVAAFAERPFFAAYVGTGEDETSTVESLVDEVLDELHEDEFDEAIQGLVDEAWELAGPRMAGESYDPVRSARTERMLLEHFEPLAIRGERMAHELSERFATNLEWTESEVDAVLESYAFDSEGVSPLFEDFLKKWKNKLKNVAKKAMKVAGKVASVGMKLAGGPLIKLALSRLKNVFRPVLKKIVAFALDKVSPANRELLQKVLESLGGGKIVKAAAAVVKQATGGAADPPQPAATEPAEQAAPDVGEIQDEVDLAVAEALLGSEAESFEDASFARLVPSAAADPLGELDAAREQFIQEMTELSPGQSPQPALENFLPAVLPALKIGVKLIGRPRVVSTIASLLTPLIQPIVGKAIAPALGKTIADIGLKALLVTELESDEVDALGGRAVAAVVEETMRDVARLPLSTLEDEAELEAAVRTAHEAAVARNLPSSLVKPSIRETGDVNGTWVALPQRGTKYYKKFTKVFDVTLSPQLAEGVRTYGGRTLKTFLADVMRVDGVRRARVHIYEAIPRTRLGRVARLEPVKGLGASSRGAASLFHPLTAEAAGSLLQQPGLGRNTAGDRRRLAVGDRFYFLEIEGVTARAKGEGTHLGVAINLARSEIRVHAFIAEPSAQRIAAMLRKEPAPGAASAAVRALFSDVSSAFGSGQGHEFVRIVRPRVAGTSSSSVQADVRRTIERRVGAESLTGFWRGVTGMLKSSAAAFIAETEKPEDGVTLRAVVANPPGFDKLRAALSGKGGVSAIAALDNAAMTVTVAAGHVRG